MITLLKRRIKNVHSTDNRRKSKRAKWGTGLLEPKRLNHDEDATVYLHNIFPMELINVVKKQTAS